MAVFKYNDVISFDLPEGFQLREEYDDEGNLDNRITKGEGHADENGKIQYEFLCGIKSSEGEMLEDCSEVEPKKFADFYGKRRSRIEVDRLYLFGSSRIDRILYFLAVPEASMVLKVHGVLFEGSSEMSHAAEIYENLLIVIKSIRINGEAVEFTDISGESLAEIMQPEPEEDEGAVDVTERFGMGDGEKERSGKSFRAVKAAENLYPHYATLMDASNYCLPGAEVIVNAGGTEYQFISIENIVLDMEGYDEVDEMPELYEAYKKILTRDSGNYTLHKNAAELASVFHVNASAFSARHDRECEIMDGMLHRAYMLSALRSFAWTLADYCSTNGIEPEAVELKTLEAIVEFAKKKQWLNYNGISHCKSLCGCSDLNVFYIPDSVAKEEKEVLLSTEDDFDFNVIHNSVGSLEGLRRDLEYIYPAIVTIYESLKENRDYMKELDGDAADILYAWCSLAIAARKPFYMEDGPMTCFFVHQDISSVKFYATSEYETSYRKCKEEEFAEYIEENPDIEIKDKIFVFTGVLTKGKEKTNPLVLRLQKAGGLQRNQISGKTDYLVVDPVGAGYSKINAVKEKRKEGKNIKIVSLEDFMAALAAVEEENLKECKFTVEDCAKMYAILDTENKLGCINRDIDAFLELYDEDFSGISAKKIAKLREIILESPEDESQSSLYEETFKKLDTKEKLGLTTRNYWILERDPDLDEGARTAIEKTSLWFTPEEREKVRELMDAELVIPRKSLDSQIGWNDPNWIEFKTAKKFLRILITDRDMSDEDGRFKVVLGEAAVRPQLITENGFWTANLDDYMPWYWGVTIAEIWWNALLNNHIEDERKEPSDSRFIAKTAFEAIKMQYGAGESFDEELLTDSKPAAQNTKTKTTTTTTTTSAANTSQKNEGCYIATAVYGSYDAPEVLTLRRFRDETLKASAAGRWFIRTYYKYSPSVAKKLKNAGAVNRAVKRILDKWVRYLENK